MSCSRIACYILGLFRRWYTTLSCSYDPFLFSQSFLEMITVYVANWHFSNLPCIMKAFRGREFFKCVVLAHMLAPIFMHSLWCTSKQVLIVIHSKYLLQTFCYDTIQQFVQHAHHPKSRENRPKCYYLSRCEKYTDNCFYL